MAKEYIIRLLSSFIISIGIIISGYFIASALSTNTAEDTADNQVWLTMPDRFRIIDGGEEEFLSIFQASEYLAMDHSSFEQLVESGEFASTYVVLNGMYIFSRSRLDNYLWDLIDSKK